MSLLSEGSEGGQQQASAAQTSGNPAVGTPGNGGANIVETSAPTSANNSWRDSLPEDLRGNGSLAQFQDVASLAKSYVHAQSLIGKKGLFLPAEKASKDEWRAFYKSMGQPDIDKYDINAPQNVPVNKDFVGKFKSAAHEEGLLPKQAQGMLDWYVKAEQEAVSALQKSKEMETAKAIEGLKQEWGQGFSKQVSLAKLAVQELGGEELKKHLETTGLGNDVQLIKVLAKVGALLGEDKIRGEDSAKFGKTPEEVKKEIAEIMGNFKHPYYDTNHPGHRLAVDHMAALYRSLNG